MAAGKPSYQVMGEDGKMRDETEEERKIRWRKTGLDPDTHEVLYGYKANGSIWNHEPTPEEIEQDKKDYEKEQNGGKEPPPVKMSVTPKGVFKICKAEIQSSIIKELNEYIDEDIIGLDENFGVEPGNRTLENSYSKHLVGQINKNQRSAQLDFPLHTTTVGKQIKQLLDGIAMGYLQHSYRFLQTSVVDSFEAWTVHSFEGDYNPLHSHGVATPTGLSCILYLQVPDQIKDSEDPQISGDNPDSSYVELNDASGNIDGYTHFLWGPPTTQRDVYSLVTPSQEFVKPTEGLLLMFPSWVSHSVMPFFGEGERRTFSANFNIFSEPMLKAIKEEDRQKYVEDFRIKRKIGNI